MPPDRGRDAGPRTDSGGGGVDAGSLDCEPECVAPMICMDGRCVDAGGDGDGDGVPTEFDCDDADPLVGNMGERTCSSACGSGVERCTDGEWLPCTAPETCDCTDGVPPREIPCERCGMQRQVCSGGTWVDDGVCTSRACTPGEIRMAGPCGRCGTVTETCQADCSWGTGTCVGEGTCMAGEIETGMEGCGTCGGGTRSRTRSCGATCEWGAWGAWGACTDGGGSECSPGETDMETRACGNCNTGSQSRSRSCSGDCRWGSWSAWSGCSGGGACAPGSTMTCPGGSGSPCRRNSVTCTGSCTWPSCGLVSGAACDWVSDSGVSGGRYRCCSPPTDGWQFCLSSCQWSTACESSSACR